jgi:penicillin-binding protein 1A
VLLEAFEECGARSPLFPSRRVLDGPVEIDLEQGSWRPRNPDGRYRGPVTLRRSLVLSLNVPFVRVARWCGWEAVARRFQRAGMTVSSPVKRSFVLGAEETSPLELASAYTLFANGGRRVEPRPWTRLSRPSGRSLDRGRVRSQRVSGEAAAYLVLDLLRNAVKEGTAAAADLVDTPAWGKTGTSSGGRDAWMAGGSGRLVAVVWVGSDSGGVEGLAGGREAAWIWREFMTAGADGRLESLTRPRQVVERWVEESTGLIVGGPHEGSRRELFRRGVEPPRRRLLRRDEPLPVLE